MKNREKLLRIIKEKAYKTKEETYIISRKGRRSNWLMDLREVVLDAQALDLITDLFWEEMQKFLPFQIAGEELSSVPMIAALIQKGSQLGFNVNGLIIRKKRKKSGLCKKIEGKMTKLPIVLVDDLTNGASAFKHMYNSLEAEGVRARYFFTIIDFQNPVGKRSIEDKKVKHLSLFKLAEFGLKLTKKKGKKQISSIKTKEIMSATFSIPDYFYQKSYQSLLLNKDKKYLFLSENLSLYSLDTKKGKNDQLYNSRIFLPQAKKSNLLLDKEKNYAYWILSNSKLICFSLKNKQIKWSFPLNDFQGELKDSGDFILFVDKEELTGYFKLIVLSKTSSEIHFAQSSKSEISFFCKGKFIWIYTNERLDIINLQTLLNEEQFEMTGNNLELVYIFSNGEKVFLQDQQKILIYDQENNLRLAENFSLITNYFIDENFTCFSTVEKQLKIYQKNKLKKIFSLHNANLVNFCIKNECLYFSSNYAIFFIDLNSFQKYCILTTIEKIISFKVISDSEMLLHVAGNRLSYLNFYAKKQSS